MKPSKNRSGSLYGEVKAILEKAREKSFKTVNFLMVEAYWRIGRVIVEEEQKGKKRADYGRFLIKELSERLTKDFGRGFTETNIKYFRLFYLNFPISHALRDESKIVEGSKLHPMSGESNISDSRISHSTRVQSAKNSKKNVGALGSESDETPIQDAARLISPKSSKKKQDSVSLNSENIPIIKLSFLRTELSWTHYRLLLKLEKEEARYFYMNEAANSNWSTRELERQINSLLFERLALSKNKKAVLKMAKKGQIIKTPEDLVKDPYVLEFLGLERLEKYYESDLEQALISHLQKFLLELGKGFSFVARQQRINLDGDNFYIDLVFYNRLTKCFFLIDLKVGKLTHGDIGQVQMYVNYYDRNYKTKDENNTIGLLLCAEKNDTVVKYTLPEKQKQIFISKYLPYLPTEEELRNEITKEKQHLEVHLKAKGIRE